ncbi:hypothetical protein N0V82_004105 [Gnomoniopsis sp. IMI 355080]|nr:hypothetical protein N0V82_004105 [Gnomoniopsis sp. IMI 355080]
MDIGAQEHKAEWFASINPNCRVPAIVHVKDDGSSVTVFESAACRLYMACAFDQEHRFSYSIETPEYWTQMSWLSWQVAGYGPNMGQAAYFNRYAVEAVPYASWRFTSECRRLSHVLNAQLAKSAFIAGDRLTIADFAIFVFTHSSKWCGVDLSGDDLPHLKAWHDTLAQRPAFQKALQVPVPYPFSDKAISNPNGQEFYNNMRKYGGQMIKEATAQWEGKVASLPSDYANYEC